MTPKLFRVLIAAIGATGLLAMNAPAAHAIPYIPSTESYESTSSFRFTERLVGDTYFTVSGTRLFTNGTSAPDGRVQVAVRQTQGAAQYYRIRIERQTCDSTGRCSWSKNFVGGDCIRSMYVPATKTCTFQTGNSNRLHRVWIDHYWGFDGTNLRGQASELTAGSLTIQPA